MATAKTTGSSKNRSSSSKGSSSSKAKGSAAAAESSNGKSSASTKARAASSNGNASRSSGSAAGVKKKAQSAKTSKSSAPRSKANGSGPAKKAKPAAKGSSRNKGVLTTIAGAVAGIFSGKEQSPDAIDLLKADHDVVEELFEKVKANEDGNNKAVFNKIKAELDAHTHIEETIFYPFLLDKGKKDLKKIVQEGIEEHRQAKMFLKELSQLTGTADKFKAKLKVLIEDVEHHVREEENEMFPMVEDQFGREVLQELGARMEAEKAAFKKKNRTTSGTAKKASSKAA